jgi:hypothetical protein
LRIGKRRRVQGASYAYWVDVYVEIDYALCNDNGDTCATGIGTNTINYGEFRFFLKCWCRFVRALHPFDSRNHADFCLFLSPFSKYHFHWSEYHI